MMPQPAIQGYPLGGIFPGGSTGVSRMEGRFWGLGGRGLQGEKSAPGGCPGPGERRRSYSGGWRVSASSSMVWAARTVSPCFSRPPRIYIMQPGQSMATQVAPLFSMSESLSARMRREMAGWLVKE